MLGLGARRLGLVLLLSDRPDECEEAGTSLPASSIVRFHGVLICGERHFHRAPAWQGDHLKDRHAAAFGGRTFIGCHWIQQLAPRAPWSNPDAAA